MTSLRAQELLGPMFGPASPCCVPEWAKQIEPFMIPEELRSGPADDSTTEKWKPIFQADIFRDPTFKQGQNRSGVPELKGGPVQEATVELVQDKAIVKCDLSEQVAMKNTMKSAIGTEKMDA